MVGRFSEVVQKLGMQMSKCDHLIFYRNSYGGLIVLVVYMDDIVIIGNDVVGITSLKSFSSHNFIQKIWAL